MSSTIKQQNTRIIDYMCSIAYHLRKLSSIRPTCATLASYSSADTTIWQPSGNMGGMSHRIWRRNSFTRLETARHMLRPDLASPRRSHLCGMCHSTTSRLPSSSVDPMLLGSKRKWKSWLHACRRSCQMHCLLDAIGGVWHACMSERWHFHVHNDAIDQKSSRDWFHMCHMEG